MNGRPKGRHGTFQARKEWTARLNRFAAAKTSKQRQAVIEPSFRINPGGTLKDLLMAWGYSASSRGRKAKGAEDDHDQPSREKLQAVLNELFGPSAVPSLFKKLAGGDATVRDACRIAAALLHSWPVSFDDPNAEAARQDSAKARAIAELFIRELLNELSGGRSRAWTEREMEVRGFSLVDEERVGVSQFIKEASETEGALIVAGAKSILLGPDPIEIIRQAHHLLGRFVGGHNGLLVFVFNSALFEAGKSGFNILYNSALLSTAITGFALFREGYDYQRSIQEHEVDWSFWRQLSRRCCVVLRKPPLIDPQTGKLLKQRNFDDFIAGWRPEQKFDQVGDLRGFVRFDSDHILPRTYPPDFGEALLGKDLYWDVLIQPKQDAFEGLAVKYYTPPIHAVEQAAKAGGGSDTTTAVQIPRQRGRPSTTMMSVEEDVNYVVARPSPGERYDDAQRAIYMAARGRLNLDEGEKHQQNLNAAAALRQVGGFEVLPISIMVSLFPRALLFAAMAGAD